ncbi:MAG: hydrogenase maturation nickel metallochaperone HypA [Desulfovibrionaceae bacterium]|jgi:hydrogenase nickel incorporation protein HypA/HybF|nr:hydrogenase maturation nickel metallochaperone HypA [Desulfovibrionaceae bacterium]
MHETALVAGILRIVEEEAATHGVRRVARVRVQVGPLAAVEPRTLASCFEIYAEGTCADGAELVVETLPARGTCRVCGRRILLHDRRWVCPFCASRDLCFEGGNEMVIAGIEARANGGNPQWT